MYIECHDYCHSCKGSGVSTLPLPTGGLCSCKSDIHDGLYIHSDDETCLCQPTRYYEKYDEIANTTECLSNK